MGTHHTDALLRFVRRWFDERTVASVFEPLLAYKQREWLDGPPASRLWIAMRTAVVLIVSMVRLAPRALVLTPTPPSMTRRLIARMVIFVSVVSGLMMIPFFSELGEVPPGRLAWLLMWLLPSMALIAFPFAMAEGRERNAAIQRELHNRASFALLPLVLIWLRWRALNHPSPEWLFPPWLSATVLIGAYFFLRENDRRIELLLGLGPGAAAWVPLAVFLALGWIRDRAAARTVTSIFHA